MHPNAYAEPRCHLRKADLCKTSNKALQVVLMTGGYCGGLVKAMTDINGCYHRSS